MNKKKKIIIIVFAAMCVFGIAAGYLLYVNPSILKKTQTPPQPNKETVGMYGSTQSHIFYPADDDLDPSTVSEYMDLDRYVHYTDGAQTIVIDEENSADYSADLRFFLDYFNIVINGDYTKYNSLFTKNYFETYEKTCDFTPQMLYDINVEKLSDSEENGHSVYYYNVSYKIFRNNGTFRNDIGSDASRTLLFTLIESDGRIMIDYIDYYV